ncbi:MAG: hypothetical protein IPM75_14690 [Candidatus Competibacteraceae bacterium]|nr:hypothetical protein [Candidatus Competibacteraceae bacterium]
MGALLLGLLLPGLIPFRLSPGLFGLTLGFAFRLPLGALLLGQLPSLFSFGLLPLLDGLLACLLPFRLPLGALLLGPLTG